jgi:neutral ceramidase
MVSPGRTDGIALIRATIAAAGGEIATAIGTSSRAGWEQAAQLATTSDHGLMQLLPLLLWATIAGPGSATELRAGAAAVVITPPPRIPMAGYYSERAALGIHDDLFAKVIVIEQGGTRAALVALDLIAAPRDLVEDTRSTIERSCRVPGANVMISATHSHTGPIVDTKNRFGGQSDLVKSYRASLPARIADAVRQAESRLARVTLSAARGREISIAFNRRFHMKDGSVGWNPGKGNPLILKPAGTIDPDVPVLYFETADQKPVATYVNYAVHLDNIGEPLISADMPATLSRCLSDFKGPEMVTLFTAGCCGDVNHIDVHWKEAQRGFGNPARMGIILAGEVLRAWPRLQPIDASTLRIKSTTLSLPLAELKNGDVEKARATVARMSGEASQRPPFMEIVQAFKALDVAAQHGKPHDVEVQVIALGKEVAWVSLPGEVFTELGLAIKQDSPFPITIIAELANGLLGYIPARRAYGQGNYEVVSARCAEGSGERLVDAAVKILKELHVDEPASQRPQRAAQ